MYFNKTDVYVIDNCYTEKWRIDFNNKYSTLQKLSSYIFVN